MDANGCHVLYAAKGVGLVGDPSSEVEAPCEMPGRMWMRCNTIAHEFASEPKLGALVCNGPRVRSSQSGWRGHWDMKSRSRYVTVHIERNTGDPGTAHTCATRVHVEDAQQRRCQRVAEERYSAPRGGAPFRRSRGCGQGASRTGQGAPPRARS